MVSDTDLLGSGNSLPDHLATWLDAVLGHRVSRIERAAARREAWIVDATTPSGEDEAFWLRVTHGGDAANSLDALVKETAILRGLQHTRVPVPKVVHATEGGDAALFERVSGRTDLDRCPLEQQQAVYRHLLEILGELHTIDDPEAIGADLGPVPNDARGCALDEVDARVEWIGGTVGHPLASFGVDWLRRNAPSKVERVSLLHGDIGIANFLFVDNTVSAVIDWEWAHLGDPLEDLGNLLVHSSFAPSGDWPDLLPEYEKACGIPVDVGKVRYYAVSNLVRSVLQLIPITARVSSRDPVALNLCYKIICDRLMCEAIAEAMGIELDRPEVPEWSTDEVTLLAVVADNLEDELLSAGPMEQFRRDRLGQARLLAQYVDRQHRFAAWREDAEVSELTRLLGRRPGTRAEGLGELDELVRASSGERAEDVLRYLARSSYRAEAIASPLVSLFPDVHLRPLVRRPIN